MYYTLSVLLVLLAATSAKSKIVCLFHLFFVDYLFSSRGGRVNPAKSYIFFNKVGTKFRNRH